MNALYYSKNKDINSILICKISYITSAAIRIAIYSIYDIVRRNSMERFP